MTPTELQQLIREFYLERLALLKRHEAGARLVTDYDINNAYQYIVNREETHVSWLQHALLDMGAELPAEPTAPTITGKGKDADVVRQIAGDDGRSNQQFIDKWRDRVELVTNARHKGMLRVVLGEMLEHKRLFEQAAAGRTDVIGTPMSIHERRGKVLSTRWVE